jgi:hypothetical protein
MPDMIGAMPPKKPVGPPSPMEQEPDGDEGGAKLDPMTVGYHEEARNCGNCEHQQNGNCNVIGQQVTPEGGCCVWEGSDADDMGGESDNDGDEAEFGGESPATGGYGR